MLFILGNFEVASNMLRSLFESHCNVESVTVRREIFPLKLYKSHISVLSLSPVRLLKHRMISSGSYNEQHKNTKILSETCWRCVTVVILSCLTGDSIPGLFFCRIYFLCCKTHYTSLQNLPQVKVGSTLLGLTWSTTHNVTLCVGAGVTAVLSAFQKIFHFVGT